MKEKKGKVGLIVVILLVCIIIGGMLFLKNKNKPQINNSNNNNVAEKEGKDIKKEYEESKEEVDLKGSENIKVEEGKIVNTSSKVKEAKTYEGCSINVSSLTAEENNTELILSITNNTQTDKDLDMVKVEIIDGEGKVFKEIEAYFGMVKQGETKAASISTQIDIANMSDIRYKK